MKPRARSSSGSTPRRAPGGTTTFLSRIALRTIAPAPTCTSCMSTESETSAFCSIRTAGETTDR